VKVDNSIQEDFPAEEISYNICGKMRRLLKESMDKWEKKVYT
jgi:hypothetical protein